VFKSFLMTAAFLPGLALAPAAFAIERPGDAPGWRALVGFRGDARQSDVITPEFFLAPDGRVNPHAELEATRVAMALPVGARADAHAQCRFPARYLWLKRQGLVDGVADVTCPAFNDWRGDQRPTGASVIFASGDLSNPATFYGHMMLRLTTGSEGHDGTLLENIINNGAAFPPNENPLVYVSRGLTGQYKATYSRTSFYEHVHRYGEAAMRDIWEYKLNLTQDQTDLLTAHAFELQGVYNRYYFLRQNCAYRIADLVNAATGRDVIPPDKIWTMPGDVLDEMSEAQNDGVPLIRSVERMDSRKSRLRDKYLNLPGDERARVVAFLGAPKNGLAPAIDGLDPKGQVRVTETLLDYYSIATLEPEKASSEDKTIRQTLLVARMRQPAGKGDFQKPPTPLQPHEGQKSTLTMVTAGDNSVLGGNLQLRLRFAYNDFLSVTPGALPYSELSFGDLRFETDGNKVTIRQADIIRITTLNVSQTGLPGDGGPAWRLRLALEQERLDCDDCLTAVAEGNVGKSFWLNRSTLGYVLAGGRISGPEAEMGDLQGGVTGGLLFNAGRPWRLGAEAGAWQSLTGAARSHLTARIETRIAISRNLDLAASVASDSFAGKTTTEVRSGLAIYW
jgi:hypothetical protein